MKTTCNLILFRRLLLCLLLLASSTSWSQPVINDITRLNPIQVDRILAPETEVEICEAVKNHQGPVSVGGGRYSMGGQTATEGALYVDMRGFDSILGFSADKQEITVQAGATWRKIQEFIDPYDLSVQIMQTYANFSVGGSLSVNVHGRYIGQGPLILSVKEIRIVLADGEVRTASPAENADLFYGAIGGYGGLGIITQATLSLTTNCRVERKDEVLLLKDYRSYFMENIAGDSSIVFHNADIYPNGYRRIRAISYSKTDKEVTVPQRLKPSDRKYGFNRFAIGLISEFPGGKWLRQFLFDPVAYRGRPVEWRNYEASYEVLELEPRSREKSTYVLQEYFVPVDQFDRFYPLMIEILRKNRVNVINVSIRHAKRDPGSMLAWAQTDVFAFVIYYKQGTKPEDKEEVKTWTRELIDAALSCKGTYYLPYQIHATSEQFARAYPGSPAFFELKKRVDPGYKFRNKLWDEYYRN